MGKAKATTAVAMSGLLVVAQTLPAWAGSAAPADPWLHLAIDQPAAGQKPARLYLAAMPSIARRAQPILPAQAPAPDLSTPENGLSDDVKEAIGCAAVGSVATVAAVAVGGQNLVNIIAGGVVAPANPGVLYLGLVGVIFAAFCGIAKNLMPIYLHATKAVPEPQVTPSKLPADGSKRAVGPTVILAASAQVSERLSAKFDQVAMWSGQTADGLAAQVSERLSAKFDQVATWSGQTADGLGAQISERLSVKFDQAAVWSGQIMEKSRVKADAVSVKAAETALWSEQMIDSLTADLGLQ
jgi:hypothetical protein